MHERPALAVARRLHRLGIAPLWSWLLPTACAGCARPLGARQPLGVCPTCWAALRPLPRRSCPRCASPAGSSLAGCAGSCSHPAVSRTVAAVRYDGVARRLLLGVKLGGRRELLEPMGRMLARVAAPESATADRIVPVPSHPWTGAGRGFSPAHELARILRRATGGPEDRAALRRRLPAVRRVVGLDRRARRRAVRGAFVSPGRRPLGRVLLVADVTPTGATGWACAAALREAGADEVVLAVWARTPPSATVPAADPAVVSPHRFV